MLWTEGAHYCVPKAMHLVSGATVTTLDVVLPVTTTGEMDMEKLEEVVHGAKTLGVDGFLLVCTLGTTFLGKLNIYRKLSY